MEFIHVDFQQSDSDDGRTRDNTMRNDNRKRGVLAYIYIYIL
jgi:hypothetical protein